MRAGWLALGAPALAAIGLAASFAAHGRVGAEGPLPRDAVVFTGQYDRISLAMSLFDGGGIDRLLISGVNRPAGLDPATLPDRFDLTDAARKAIGDGRIVLSPHASDTLANAAETACWLSARPGAREILLVTSRSHMARASLALRRALPGQVRIVRLAPPAGPRVDTEAAARARLSELAKFAATWLVTLAPTSRSCGAAPT